MTQSQSTDLSTEVLSPQDVTKLLQGAGFLDADGPNETRERIKVNGTTFEAGEETFISTPKKPVAFTALLTEQPKQYQSYFFDKEDPGDMALLQMMVDPTTGRDRTHLAGGYCKSWFDEPTQARERNEAGDSCRACLINPYVRKDRLPVEANGNKCKWRGEFYLRILDEDRKVIDDKVYSLDVATTGMMEWQGISSNPEKGYFDHPNALQRLAELGQTKYGGQAGIFKALTALKLGGVIVEVSATQTSSGRNNFSVVSIFPVDILDELTEERPAIAPPADVPTDDDIPF